MEPGEALGIAAQIAVALAGFAGVVVVFRLAVTMTKYFRRLDVRQIPRERATGFVFYLFGMFGIAVNLLQLYNAALLGVFWLFFTCIVFQVITALFQFARMILLLPE